METFTGLIFFRLSRASVLCDSFLISDNTFCSLKRTLRYNPKYMENFLVYVEIHGNIYRAYFGRGMRAIFQKKGKKGKIFEHFGKNLKNLKII